MGVKSMCEEACPAARLTGCDRNQRLRCRNAPDTAPWWDAEPTRPRASVILNVYKASELSPHLAYDDFSILTLLLHQREAVEPWSRLFSRVAVFRSS